MEPRKNRILVRCVAVCGLALLVGWPFYHHSIGSLNRAEMEELRQVKDLRERIDAAHKTIAETRVLQRDATEPQDDLPTGSVQFWCPDRIKKVLGAVGIPGAAIRFNTALKDPAFPDFARTYWVAEAPLGNSTEDVREAWLAVDRIEPADPILRVLNVAIRPDANDPTRRTIAVIVSVLAPKE